MSCRTSLVFVCHSLLLRGLAARQLVYRPVGCAVALIAAAGCTEFESGSDIERSTGSLLGPTPGDLGGTPWTCLDATPAPSAASRSSVSYTITVVDSVTNLPPAGLAVKPCDDVDVNCTRPVAPSAGVSADGRVRLSLAPGFDGYFEVTSDTTIPSILFPDGVLREDQDGVLLELIDEATLGDLVGATGIEVSPDTGLIGARAFDCNGDLSSGVEFQNDTGGIAFAFIEGLPIQGATTGGEGLVVFTNVPTGYTFIEGTLAFNNRPMGSTTAESRPGFLVYVDVRPPP